MRRLRSASFAIAVALATATYAVALGVTAVAVVATLPCQWAAFRLPDAGVCAASTWPDRAVPWVLLFGGMAIVGLLGAGAVHAGALSWRRTRQVVRALEASASEPSVPLRRAAAAAGVGRVREVDVPQAVALCYGVRRPVVLVSTPVVRRLADDELLAVMVHEGAHVLRRDPLRLAVLRCVSAFGVAVPALRRLVAHSVLVGEWAADRSAARAVGVPVVASALLALLRDEPAVDPDRVNAPGFCLTGDRIALLGRREPPLLRMSRSAAVWSAATAAVALYVVVAVAQALSSTAGVVSFPIE